MAKIRYGSLAGSISGSVGNDTFTRGRYGAVVRMRTIPTKRVTVYTTAVRGRMASVSQAWGALTAPQMAAWEAWAKEHQIVDRLGDPQTLQGNSAYIQLNARIDALGGTAIAVPPTAVPPVPIEGLTLTCKASDQSASLAWTSGAVGADCKLAVWAAVLTSPGRNYYKNLLKLVKYSAAAAATPLAFGTELVARFGTLQEGQRVFLNVFVYDSTTGLGSGMAICNTTVVAGP